MKLFPKILSFWTLFVVLFVSAIIVIAGLFVHVRLIRSDKIKAEQKIHELELEQANAEFEKQKAESERRKLEEQANRVLAQNKQEALLHSVKETMSSLDEVSRITARLHEDLAVIKTNQIGRAIASRPSLVSQARRLFEDESQGLSPQSTIQAQQSSIQQVEKQLESQLGTANEPVASLVDYVRQQSVWAAAQKQTASIIETRLLALKSEAKGMSLNSGKNDVLTLNEAVSRLTALENQSFDEIIQKKSDAAKIEATNTVADARADAITERGKIEAERIQRATQFVIATNAVERTKTEIDITAIETQRQKMLLRQKASSPQIQASLQCFLAPGFWQPAIHPTASRSFTVERGPMSYSAIYSKGALSRDLTSLRAFVDIGKNPHNDRPFIGAIFAKPTWYRDADRLAVASQLQSLMIELGPTFVDMGLMKP